MPALPIVIFLAFFAAGAVAAARWLPSLPLGRIGLVFVVVTGMLAAALALVGLHVYSIVHELSHSGDHNEEAEIIAGGLRNLLWQAGTIFGLAWPFPSRAAAGGGRRAGERVRELPLSRDRSRLGQRPSGGRSARKRARGLPVGEGQ